MTVANDAIDLELAAFAAQKDSLETHHMGEWVLFHGQQPMGFYPTFESAANDAVARFEASTYLIRQIGASPMVTPASVAYFQNAQGELRVR